MDIKDMVLLTMFEETLKSPNSPGYPINSEQLCICNKTFLQVIGQLTEDKYIKNPKMREWGWEMPEFIVLYNWEITELGKAYIHTKLKKTSKSGTPI